MSEFILGLLLTLSTSSTEDLAGYHSAATSSAKAFVSKSVQSLSSPVNSSWSGHFAANNFRSTVSKKELEEIKKTLRRAVSSLPKSHTENLDSLEVRNQAHESRGMANSHKMILHTGTIDTQEELAAIFIHEMGHVVDLGEFKGTVGSEESAFYDGQVPVYKDDLSLGFYKLSWKNSKNKKIGSSRKDFVSGYALSDPFEDFAEHYAFYRLHGEKFRLLAKNSPVLQKKYDFLKYQVFNGKSYQNQKVATQGFGNDIWDTTLLSYEMRKDLLSKN